MHRNKQHHHSITSSARPSSAIGKVRPSAIVNPDGEVVAQAKTEEDERVVAACDLNATIFGKQTVFDFQRHRRIEHYGRISSQTGVILPPEA